ncbi:hypothetical protein ABD68_14940 [Bacillus endophyticus]|nr:hypothetical protein [Priestia endophytica]
MFHPFSSLYLYNELVPTKVYTFDKKWNGLKFIIKTLISIITIKKQHKMSVKVYLRGKSTTHVILKEKKKLWRI